MYTISRLILIASVLLSASVVALVTYFWPIIGIITILVIAVAFKRSGGFFTSHGTARWASPDDVSHLQEGEGLLIGHMEGARDMRSRITALLSPRVRSNDACQRFLMKKPKLLLKLNRAVHSAIFAPTGVGKGVSCVMPFLLTCKESCVVVDFKGENAKITAAHRRKKFGHKVVIIDPFKVVTNTPDTFNPLEFIDPNDPLAIDHCRALAEALVVRTGQEKEPHWNDAAESWIAAMTAVTVAFAEGEDKSLQAVRALLTNPQKMEMAIKLMCESDVWGGMLARMGHQLTYFKDKELNSTLTTTSRFLRFLDTLAIADSTKKSSFSPADLLKGNGITVYLVLPPEHMRAQSALLRLWIGSLLKAVVKGGLQEKRKVHFVLDEAASLGHMEALDDALDKYRGYGVRLQLYYQSMGQLELCWPEGRAQTVLSNTTQVFFGVNDNQTADWISTRLGDETLLVGSWGTNQGRNWSSSTSAQGTSSSSGGQTGSNYNWSQMARRLLKPEEVMNLPQRVAITFAPGELPMWTWLVRYYEKNWNPRRFLPAVQTFFASVFVASVVGIVALGMTLNLRPERNSNVERKVRANHEVGGKGTSRRDDGGSQGGHPGGGSGLVPEPDSERRGSGVEATTGSRFP